MNIVTEQEKETRIKTIKKETEKLLKEFTEK